MKFAAEKNSTLANLTSLDHSWSHTCRIIIICGTREFINFLIYLQKVVCYFFFQYTFLVSSRWLPATLFFSDVNLRCLWHSKRNHNMGWGSVWSPSLKRTFHLFLSPRCSRGLEGGGRGWGCEGFIIGPYRVLPLLAWVDLEAMAIKGYSSFPKAPALLEPYHLIG